MMALVRGVTFSSILLVSMLCVLGSMSTNTTRAPVEVTASDVAIKVFAAVMTSSPCPMPSTLRAMKRASVPLPTPTQCFTPQYWAKADSKDFTKGPPTKADFEITSLMAQSISGFMLLY